MTEKTGFFPRSVRGQDDRKKHEKNIMRLDKNKFLNIFLLLTLLVGLSGCQFKKTVSQENGKQDILMAQDCGMDGLKCCADEPSCSFGQKCCVDPNDPSRNRCANECSCGHLEEFCCQGDSKCQAGLNCTDGNCVACGKEKEPCCGADKTCQAKAVDQTTSLTCANNVCVACGRPGNPCCALGKKCQDQLPEIESLLECKDGLCSECGANGLIACQGESGCVAGQLLNNNICYKCGGSNQPCCRNQKNEQICDSKDQLTCDLGFCK